jgi:hypothetical protein
MSEVLEVKKIGIWSLVKLFFMINALVGLLFAVILAVVGMSGMGMGELPFSVQGSQLFGTGALIAVMIVSPILYGLMGAIFGLISGLLYNILAWGVGGVRLTLNRS